MKKYITILTLLPCFVFLLSSCDKQTDPQVAANAPEPQLANNCADCRYNGAFDVLDGLKSPENWAPFVESNLAVNFLERLPSSANCSDPVETRTVSWVTCFRSDLMYDYACATRLLCSARDEIFANRPVTTSAPGSIGPATVDRWLIKEIKYYHDPNVTCPIFCEIPTQIVTEVVYERYVCDLTVSSSNEFQDIRVEFPGGGGGTGGTGGTGGIIVQGEGQVELTVSYMDPANMTDLKFVEILDPVGAVYQTVYPAPPKGDGKSILEFEMVEHSLNAAKLVFYYI